MGKQNLGRVVMVAKGDYDASVQYEALDVVQYNGDSYVAKVAVKGVAPSDGEYYMRMTQMKEPLDEALLAAKTATEAAESAASETLAAKDTFLAAAGAAMEEIRNVVDDGTDAPPIICAASGDTIAVSDSAERLLQGLRIFGKTTQDGTPTPDAPVDLVSVGDGGEIGVTVAGKNLLNHSAVDGSSNGVTWVVNEDRSITFDGTPSSWTYMPILTSARSVPKEWKGHTFVLSSGVANVGVTVNVDGVVTTAYATEKSVTFPENASTYYVQMSILAGTELKGATAYPMLRSEGTDATYEPYKSDASLTISTPNSLPGIPVTSGGNYTDENGQQWICDEVDFARGVYVQRIGKTEFDGSADEGWLKSSTSQSGKYRYASNHITDTLKPPASNNNVANVMATAFRAILASTNGTYGCNTGISADLNGNIFCYCDQYNTSDDTLWTKYLSENPMTVLYERATPIETALSAEELAAYAALHTNYPHTTVLNDAGAHMEVKYVADTKNYIDNKFAELAAAIVSNT